MNTAPTTATQRASVAARDLRTLIPPVAHETSAWRAFGMFAREAFVYSLGAALVAFPRAGVGMQLFGALLLGSSGANLFVVAHEAFHFNFTGRRALDRCIAYISLLPGLMPLAPSIYSHVLRHHRYTNIQHYDTQWSPLSRSEYQALSRPRRLLERLYRSGYGLGFYFGIMIVLRMYLPRGLVLSETVRPNRADRGAFNRDRAIVLLYIAANLLGWPLWASATGLSPAITLLCGFVVPVLICHWLLGVSTYSQHTDENVPWFDSPASWSFFEGQLAGTLDLIPSTEVIAPKFSAEQPHGAHHVDMNVSVFGLRKAQRALDAAFPDASPKKVLTFRALGRTLRACKLYDFEAQRWLDFDGRPTGAPYVRKLPGAGKILPSVRRVH